MSVVHRCRAFLLVIAAGMAGVVPGSFAETFNVRVVAANLTSGLHQSYSPDNGNHSNPEGAGARILQALHPDIVALQEFNTSVPARQWINATFSPDFQFYREEDAEIPNGIVSRFPIIAAGEWDDPVLANRDFAWAKIALPNHRTLWVVSVHLYSKKAGGRARQTKALVDFIEGSIPPADFVLVAGDFNTVDRREACLEVLRKRFVTEGPYPKDPFGDEDTNAGRSKPYDWILASRELDAAEKPVDLGGTQYGDGLIFDTRTFPGLDRLPPAQLQDSAAPQMQHMAVIRDFEFTDDAVPRETPSD